MRPVPKCRSLLPMLVVVVVLATPTADAGSARVANSLKPPGPGPSAPSDGIMYALSGWVGRSGATAVAVAVVDLGDGDRWARALHAASAAPLLLWRAPLFSRAGSAPCWLEKQRGYVLAGNHDFRLLDFASVDTDMAACSQHTSVGDS